jgi:hypothetical protein
MFYQQTITWPAGTAITWGLGLPSFVDFAALAMLLKIPEAAKNKMHGVRGERDSSTGCKPTNSHLIKNLDPIKDTPIDI